MEPGIPTGSVAYIDVKDRTDLEVGDVIMYRASEEINVTHRIVDFDSAGNLITKGDANDTADLRPVSPNSVVGTYVFNVPYIGKIAAYFTTARKLVVGIALIVFNIIAQGAEHLFGDDEDDEDEDDEEKESESDEVLLSTAFRIYLSQDMTGVEVCGAMKNVIAIVCGISAGSGAGDNTLALIMTRGLAEISRLVHARGGQAMTCMGLAGMGDLIATCTSEHSRNRTFGYEFAHGVSLDEYQERTHMVVEGAVAARSVSELARSLGVDIPLTFAVEQTLYNGVTLDRALEILTDRVPSQEFYGLTD